MGNWRKWCLERLCGAELSDELLDVGSLVERDATLLWVYLDLDA